jgi:hypothetical protein
LKSKILIGLVGILCLSAGTHALDTTLPGADETNFMRHKDRGSKLDRNALREEVDETQALVDALARESRGLSVAQTDPLFASLRDEYHLGGYVGKARQALAKAEEVLEVQDAVKLQQEQVKRAGVGEQAAEDAKLLGLQSELTSVVEDLRDILRDIHGNAGEDTVRDLRNWLMISEGLLRNRREAAVAAGPGAADNVSASAEAPLTYEGASPTASTQAVSVSPTAQASATPIAKKKGKP